ncbi:hypothetical protein FLA105534_00174 [Flavobacterium bizetiae]|nr:hypothetical protein FLA105534_00174 [Flavobacterium bizetiae]
MQGIAGTDGKDGVDGAVGPQGLAGATGAQGPKGDDGAVGATGPQGLQGIAGPAGAKGDTGAQGPIGLTGATGVAGPQGLTGATGAQGPKGDDGARGLTGAAGAQGPIGLTGATGVAGPKGDKGDIGATGATGPAGNPAPVYTAGTGIAVDNTNRIISALNTTNLWNANQLQGRPISTTAPTANQVLGWNGTNWTPSTIAINEPWRVSGTTNEANGNTQNIYQMGNISIGTTAASTYRLNVSGGNQLIGGSVTPTLNFLSTGAANTNANAQGRISFWESGGENTWGGGLEFTSPAGTAMNTLDIYGVVSGVKRTVASFDVQNGRLGIGTSAPARELSVVGNAVISKTLQIDGENLGDGTLRTGLFFGNNTSGEGISSNRAIAANGNQNGLDFWTGANRRMSIINNGNVGIGKLDPGTKLDVVGVVRSNGMNINNGLSSGNYNNSAELNFVRTATNERWVMGSSLNGRGNDIFELAHLTGANLFQNRVFVYDRVSSSFAINQASANTAYRFYVNGAAGGTTTWAQSSDRRYKKDITPIANALEKIMKINGVGYNWRTDEFKEMSFDQKHQLGVIAQDIEAVLPEAVTVDDKGYYSVSYTTLIPVLVEAVKEQQNVIVLKDKKLQELEQTQKKQQAELEDLKNAVKQLLSKK